MKERKLRDRHTNARTLEVQTTRKESLNYKLAEHLLHNADSVLLPFKYESKGNGRRNLFYYDITGRATLRDYVQMGISGAQYVQLLRSIGRLGDLSASTGLPLEAVRFDDDSVYVDDGNLEFCCIPIMPVPAGGGQVLSLIGYLANASNIRFVLPEDAGLTQVTMDYVRRASIFSSFDFNEFLSARFGVGPGKDVDAVGQRTAGAAQGNGAIANVAVGKGNGTIAENAYFDPFTASAPVSVSAPSSAQEPVPALPSPTPTAATVSSPPPALPIPTPSRSSTLGNNADIVSVSDTDPGTRLLGVSGQLGERLEGVSSASSANGWASPDSARFTVAGPEAGQDHDVPGPRRGGADADVRDGSVAAVSHTPYRVRTSDTDNDPTSSGLHRNAGGVEFRIVLDRDGSCLCKARVDASVGRSSRCVARIRGNTNVSRMHALVTDLGGGAFSVEDLGSGNGTVVRGERLSKGERAMVSIGERFNVADETIHVEV